MDELRITQSGQRLDKWLVSDSMSRSRAAALIQQGHVRVNGKVVTKSSFIPDIDDIVAIDVPGSAETVDKAEDIPLRILYEDDALAVVDKPFEQRRDTWSVDLSGADGNVAVVGGTRSGKSTTLYASLARVNSPDKNIITVEDPIEYLIPGIGQIQVRPKIGLTFSAGLRSILRQDPDVICVGEIRDEETAEIAVRAAQTGHLVLATIHCDSNPTALTRLLDLGVSPMLLSSGLSLVMSQRLLRKLCPKCKQPAKLTPAVAAGLRQRGVDTRLLYQASGCDFCAGTGYYGRMAVCDLLPVTDELRSEMAHNPSIAAKLRTEGEKKSRTNMRNEAFRAATAGLTSLEEFKRVVG